MKVDGNTGAVMVVGGGIGGIQASLDLADAGYKVYLVEEKPSIGGVMAQLDKTFPTNDCSMCILSPKLVDCGRHINIEKLTYSEIVGIQGEPGRFHIQVRKKARSVDASKCTGCEECAKNCLVRYKPYLEPVEVVEPELHPKDQSIVDDIIERHRGKTSPLTGVLQDINEEFSFLPAPMLRYVSRTLDIPLAHILTVSTFYPIFSLKNRGRHVITVCQGTSCEVRGSGKIIEELGKTLGIKPGEITQDGKFGLETVNCLGTCALAPCMRIGQNVYANVRSMGIRDILGGY